MKALNAALGFTLLVLVPACNDTRSVQPVHAAASISAKPLEWQGQTVRLRGQVSSLLTLPFSAVAYYELDDGSGKIMIETTRGLPAKGEMVTLQGIVKSKVVIGDFSAGLVVTESIRL